MNQAFVTPIFFIVFHLFFARTRRAAPQAVVFSCAFQQLPHMSLFSLRGGVAAAAIPYEIMPIFYEIATLVNSLAMIGAETPLKAIKMKARNHSGFPILDNAYFLHEKA